jgi:hypothetical protein
MKMTIKTVLALLGSPSPIAIHNDCNVGRQLLPIDLTNQPLFHDPIGFKGAKLTKTALIGGFEIK